VNYTRKKLLKEIVVELAGEAGDVLIPIAVFLAGMVVLAGFGQWWMR
jgi:hypothetical protein